MNASQAFVGLHLHENVEISEALEFFIRGYIACTRTEGLDSVPPHCAEQALKTFAHHDSWGQTGYPWDRLDRDWKNAAINNLIYHIYNDHSISGQPMNEVALTHDPRTAESVDGARHSIEKEAHELGFLSSREDSVSVNNDNEIDDLPGPLVAPLLTKEKAALRTGRTALPVSILELPYELPSAANPESPLQHVALKRFGNNSSATVAPSSSPL